MYNCYNTHPVSIIEYFAMIYCRSSFALRPSANSAATLPLLRARSTTAYSTFHYNGRPGGGFAQTHAMIAMRIRWKRLTAGHRMC